jgi:flagellar protein FliS
MQSVARTYFQTQVSTTTQGDLLIMLFDGALNFLAQARERIEAKDYAQKGILISNTLDILAELQATLNPEKGGKLAERLKMLYLYCSTRLLRANMKMDLDALDETVRILTGLREAFAEANSRVETRAVAATPSQSMASRGAVSSSATAAPRGPGLGSLGAAAYARAGRSVASPAASAPATPVKVPSSLPHGTDGSSLDEAHDSLGQAPVPSPEVVVQAASPSGTEEAPRPMTPVRRVMAAYSTGNSR